ncbi:MAG: hypothetical protein ABJB76_04055 [Candidatus Nitrosocosmicus sp.]
MHFLVYFFSSDYTHIYHILCKWGFKQKVPRIVHVNTAVSSNEEKKDFKKRSPLYLCISKKKNTF